MTQAELLMELGGSLITNGYGFSFHASGHSMHPTIRNGERIVIQPVNLSDIQVSDVLLYRTARGPIAHRVIQKSENDTFVMRGDAGSTIESVCFNEVIGKVTCVFRKGKPIRVDSFTFVFTRFLAFYVLPKLLISKRYVASFSRLLLQESLLRRVKT